MNSTIASILDNEQQPALQIIGYVALLLSCLAFGTMFVPLRKKDCRDGLFVQWIECSVVFVVGLIFYAARGFPKFQPIACIGGFLYSTGNVFSVPIIEGIGTGIGFLLWTSLQDVKNDVMNYIGVVLTVASGVLLIFVQRKDEESDEKSEELNNGEEDAMLESSKFKIYLEKVPFVVMAIVLACFHGLMMSPIEYLKQRNPTTDTFQVFDYIFPFYSSVFIFSTLYFLIYCVIQRQKAYISKDLMLPSIGYGLLWTTGMTLWFLSSDKLSQVVAYPCTARLPPLISGGLDVFIFKTIQGTRSLLVLAISATLGVISVILIALSNQI